MNVSFSQFDAAYRATLDEIWPHWNETMQAEIARHNVGWSPGKTDFLNYLRLSSTRFYKAYQAAVSVGAGSICDVGAFWGVWPMTAKKLGLRVAMTETLSFYGSSFGPLFEQIRKSGVQLYDIDPFEPHAEVPETFDLVTAMAVIEHYPHSLKTFLENISALTVNGGVIFLDVPNIAYWPKRTALLAGRSPLSDIKDIYESDVPFIGHHHEFTRAELRDLAHLAHLNIIEEDAYNYSLADANRLKLLIRHPAMSAALAFFPNTRECLTMLCRPGSWSQ
jgi:2-polyprenyl-3-methyl-5-hydroxy-6-metoxy-1,4-benzoquinol methylase